MSIQGKVESKSRAGTGIKVNGVWYNGTKEQLAGIEWKSVVELESGEQNKITSIKLVSSRDSGSSGSAPPAPDYKDRQNAIEFQSARRDAITTVGILVEQGIVTLPNAKDAKYEAFMGLIDTVTAHYYTAEAPERNASA